MIALSTASVIFCFLFSLVYISKMDRRPRIDRTHWSRTGVIRTIAKSQRENVIAAQKRFRETAEGHLRPRFENEDLRRWFGKNLRVNGKI